MKTCSCHSMTFPSPGKGREPPPPLLLVPNVPSLHSSVPPQIVTPPFMPQPSSPSPSSCKNNYLQGEKTEPDLQMGMWSQREARVSVRPYRGALSKEKIPIGQSQFWSSLYYIGFSLYNSILWSIIFVQIKKTI